MMIFNSSTVANDYMVLTCDDRTAAVIAFSCRLKPHKSHQSLNMFKSCLVNPFAPGDFAEKRVLKLVEWFSGHCRAIKS